jgi:coenzyme F420-0:L-glutamate ligase / coenzyme F420-1:gamma-L-glutamate ligase
MRARIELIALDGVPLITTPTAVGDVVCSAMSTSGRAPHDGDVIVIAHKIVSKAEDRVVPLASVEPSDEALSLARTTGKDARLVELILRESFAVVRVAGPVLIMEHRLGFVCANAAVDQSNAGGEGLAVLLPVNPDRSAGQVRSAVRNRFGVDVGVIIADSHGRPFRVGAVGVAIGVAGMPALSRWHGRHDLDARPLVTSEEAIADELAAAATVLMGQGDEGRPIVVIRGLDLDGEHGSGQHLLRDRKTDLFRS